MLSRITNILVTAGLALVLLSVSVPASADRQNVFVRNQPVELEQGSVSVIHFIRLLDEPEREKVRLEGRSLLVTDQEGVDHVFLLNDERKLSEWDGALTLLGYVRRVNEETGVVDFSVTPEESEIHAGRPVLEPASVRLERSLRRPGYLKAQAGYRKIVEKIGLSSDEELRQRVDRLGQRVVMHSPLSGLKWNFDVIETDVPNALCTGEGHVLVTKGLLDLNLTDDELGGVLGHEVAHGVRRHAEIYEERFREFLALRKFRMELNYELSKDSADQDPQKLRQLQSQAGEKIKRYAFILDYLKNKQDYDQDEEEEADVLGMQYAVAAGFDPNGEARALTKLKNKSVQLFGQSYDDGSRTHPPLERRLQILEMVQKRWRD